MTTETILENQESSALEPSDATQAYLKQIPATAGIFRGLFLISSNGIKVPKYTTYNQVMFQLLEYFSEKAGSEGRHPSSDLHPKNPFQATCMIFLLSGSRWPNNAPVQLVHRFKTHSLLHQRPFWLVSVLHS